MSNIALIIGSAMVIVGVGLGVFITIQIARQRKADRDESFD